MSFEMEKNKGQISTRNLESKLTDNQSIISGWCHEQVSTTDELLEEHKINLSKLLKKKEKLEESCERLRADEKDLTQKEHADADEIVQLREALSELNLKTQNLPAKISKAREDYDRKVQQISSYQSMKEKEEAKQRAALESLEAKLARFKRLGLHFVRAANDALTLVFTLIDPNDHLRKFEFSVQVNDEDKYEVKLCEPKVEMEGLLKILNETNDFSGFVQAMRKKFQDLVKNEMNC
eukprot:g1202.t1